MPERVGGFDREQIADGFRALASAQSADHIDRLISRLPVLSSPIFHAQLRQYRLSNMAEFEKEPEAYAGFMRVYDTFFTRLHELANFALTQSEPEPVKPAPLVSGRALPPFFHAAVTGLGSAVPAPDGRILHPQSDAAEIAAIIARLTKTRAGLPPWEPTPGALWCAVVVACGRCRQLRVGVRPYYLDVLGEPALLDSLRAGDYEWSACPHCSAVTVLPVRSWISEQPSPGDPLAACCTLCRVTGAEIIFRPPPSTIRKPENDRILEIRLDMIIRQLGIEQPTQEGTVLTNGVAYSLDELVRRVDSTRSTPQPKVALQSLRSAVYQKVLSGILNWQDTEQLIRKSAAGAGRDWPIEPAYVVGDLMKALIMNLFADACAEVQGRPLASRIPLAGLVAQGYAALGETARARIALARARDLAANEPKLAEGLDEIEAEILRAEGRRDEAARVSPGGKEPPGEDPESRLDRARFLQNRGLELSRAGRMREAMETLQRGASIVRELVGHEDSPDPRHTLSGTLANLASVYADCAANLDVLSALANKPVNYESLPRPVIARIQKIGSPQALMAMQKEMLGRAAELLESEFGDEVTADRLRARAIALFREAISNALDYEYLCIQCRALADLLIETGDLDEAGAVARNCAGYAARIREYGFMSAASWQLAEIAQKRGDAPAALHALSDSLETSLRQIVRSGSGGGNASLLGTEALRVARLGGDPASAILIAESAKAISTAVSLMRAVPLQGESPEPLKSLYERRETLRLRSIWEPGGELRAQIAATESAIADARRELAVHDPRAAAWHDSTYLDISRPEPFRRLLNQVGSRTTYAGFLTHHKQLFVYAIWAERQILKAVDFPAGLAETGDLNHLASVLLTPLAPRLDELEPGDRLILSPDAKLQNVPFPMLPFRGQPLFTRATVSVVNGAGVFEACAARPALAIQSAVAVGAPARPDTPELTQAAVEVEHIAATLEAAGIATRPVLSGAGATVPALAARARGVGAIHFACHASVEGSEPTARLLLAPAPLAKDSGVLSEDRILNEILLNPGCHVNLAACRSAFASGEGEYFARGLVTAFLVAGASSVLASLWPLADAPAAIFQSAYYRHIAQGLSPASALAETQRAALRGELGDDLRTPLHHGGYILHGLAMEARKAATPV